MNNNLPSNVEEAFEVFTKPEEDDAPKDCHNHCDCYWSDGHCCDCAEDNTDLVSREQIPVKDFIEEQARKHPVNERHLTHGGLSWDYDTV